MAKKRSFKPNWLLITGTLAVAWYVWKSQVAKTVSGIGGFKKSAIKNLENYILENIIPMYGENLTSNRDKLHYLINQHIKLNKVGIKKFGFDNSLYFWLQTKPKVLNIAYYYGQITDTGYNLGLLDPNKTTEAKEDKFEKNWLKLVADTISDMYKIDHIKNYK